MTARTQETLRVELDSQGDSISGRVLDEDGTGRSFSGWVGPAAAIEGARLVGVARGSTPRGGAAAVNGGANRAEMRRNAPPTTLRQTTARNGQEER